MVNYFADKMLYTTLFNAKSDQISLIYMNK